MISYHRRVMSEFPGWQSSEAQLGHLHVSTHGLIEDDGGGMLQVDFANRRVGGGMLSDGCVQEEIRFIICPELIVARLLADAMEDNECIFVIGCERFSNHVGYGDGFRWHSDHVNATKWDKHGRRHTELVAIDATPFRNYFSQFTVTSIARELNKAFCTFYSGSTSSSSVATGNWGCGAYRGDHRLKALLQMIACAVASRDLCYFTFFDDSLCRDIGAFHRFLIKNSITVGSLWGLLMVYAAKRTENRKYSENIFDFIRSQKLQC
jgi:poly(ADP-ribose) glycohydrolase